MNSENNFWLPWPFTNFPAFKTMLTSLIFSFIVFSYSIIKAVKDAVFLSMVGTDYQPWAKILVIVVSVVIFMPIYSFVMTRWRRQTLATFFPLVYAVFLFAFAAILLHPTLGLRNCVAASNRWVGWGSYIFLEFYAVAVEATFWAMLSSISTPESSKKQYGAITIASRVAGICASFLGLYMINIAKIADIVAFPSILISGGLSLLCVALLIQLLFKLIPPKYLTGYTDVYEKAKLQQTAQLKKPKFFDGLRSVLTSPYAIGIFGLIASVEIISTIMDYRMQCLIAQSAQGSAMGMLHHFFIYTLSFQVFGLFLAVFATRTLPQRIGLRKCLLITPLALMCMLSLSFFFNTLLMAMAMQVVLRGFNYGFNVPVREMLYVPTSRKIQFGAKGWVDTFGKTLSRGSGAGFNLLTTIFPPAIGNVFGLVTSLGVGCVWLVIATMVGKVYHQAVVEHRVIGSELEDQQQGLQN